MPHLNIIVVRDDRTQRPPDEVIEKTSKSPTESYQAAFERLKQQVFDYDGWNKLLVELKVTTAAESDDGG